MDPKKTGEFIALLRREQGMTQKDLAEKLNVSDKAISRWETGKGFPETGLLMTISDALGISVGELLSGQRMEREQVKEQTDQVIVQSFRQTDRKAATALWTAIGSALVIFLVVMAWIITALPREVSAMDFIRGSEIGMRYELGWDNEKFHIEYSDLLHRTLEGGYEYYAPDGTERYVFTHIPELSDQSVMSYMHCSAPGSMLFGVTVGESTLVEKNPTLGVESDYSLMEYLQDQGFRPGFEEYLYGRRSLVYIDGERCNWLFYSKDNVFIHLLVSAHEGRRLLGYDIGILDRNLENILAQQIHGYRLRIEDPYHLLRGGVEEVQLADTSITLYAMKPPADGAALYLYVNGVCIGEFSKTEDLIWSRKCTFTMLAQETTVLVTPEKRED